MSIPRPLTTGASFRRQRSSSGFPEALTGLWVLDHLAEAGHARVRLLGAGHRVVHGGERFTSSIRDRRAHQHGRPVLALVVPTDEELLIARDTAGVIAGG